MTSDFSLRVYQPRKGNDPTILTKNVSDMSYMYKGHKPIYETIKIRKYDICEKSDIPFQETLRYKEVKRPAHSYCAVPYNVSLEEKGSAKKTILRRQPNTNNMTSIAIDYIKDDGRLAQLKYGEFGAFKNAEKVVELTRDLKDGDVFELLARQDKSGKVVADKLALRSGKVIENIPEFFKNLAKELDPLAKNWLKKVLMHKNCLLRYFSRQFLI